MHRRAVLAGLAAWPALGRAGTPDRWKLVAERSAIRFGYRLDGDMAEGRFTRFSGTGRFAAARPEAARFTLRIASASIDLGNALVSAYVTSAEWFDARHHPEVVYRLTGLAPLGGGRYDTVGEIALKGRTVSVATPMRLAIGADQARARGSLALSRAAFALGTELTDLVVELGDEVTVRFDLVARRID